MLDPGTLLVFAGAALALIVIPGPAVLYILAQSVEHGRRAGVVSALGVASGGLVHIVGAAVGISALVVSSAVAFSIVKYAGAAYLLYLGVRRLLARVPAGVPSVERAPLFTLFTQGVVVNVLNPKTALFFLAFLPQFVDPERTVWTQVVAFGLVFVVLGVVSDGLYAVAAGTLGGWLRRRREVLRYASGSVFVGLGVATALAKR